MINTNDALHDGYAFWRRLKTRKEDKSGDDGGDGHHSDERVDMGCVYDVTAAGL